MIRQAISCDICATEKKQTNHWFVAYEYGGELRVSGWNSRNRLRPGSKHLCGQTCLHKLVDDFMARALATRAPAAAQEEPEIEVRPMRTDASLTSASAFEEVESSARLITPPAPPVRQPLRLPVEVVTAPARTREVEAVVAEDAPRFTSRSWRAEAWERERERELRAVERRPEIAARRRSNA